MSTQQFINTQNFYLRNAHGNVFCLSVLELNKMSNKLPIQLNHAFCELINNHGFRIVVMFTSF